MNRTISATEARIRFGEVMRWAKQGPVLVERDGKAEIVILSKQEYDRLAAAPQLDWRQKMKEIHALIRAERRGHALPLPEEMLSQARKERDEQILNNLY